MHDEAVSISSKDVARIRDLFLMIIGKNYVMGAGVPDEGGPSFEEIAREGMAILESYNVPFTRAQGLRVSEKETRG